MKIETLMELFIRFTDQSQSFAHGVEFGRLLEKLERGDQTVCNNGFPVRRENVETLREACKAYGYVPNFSTKYCGGEWVDFVGIKKQEHDEN